MNNNIYKIHIILLNLILVSSSLAQENYSLKQEFSWDEIRRRDTVLINTFIRLTPNDFEYYKLKESYTPTIKDLNNDGLDDIIFDGQSGGEPRQISIYINNGTYFKRVFNDYQRILKLVFSNETLSELVITDWGCCADVNVANRFYSVTSSHNDLIFKLVKSLKYIEDTVLPTKYWTRTKTVKILNDHYNLRTAPVINDTKEFYYGGEPTIGNTVGIISKGTLAVALGESIDTTGRIWYFVAVMPQFPVKETVFYDSKDEIKSYKCGWISSRFVEIEK